MRDFLTRCVVPALAVAATVCLVVIFAGANQWRDVPEHRLASLVLGACDSAYNSCTVEQVFSSCRENPAFQCLDAETLKCNTNDNPYNGSWTDASCQAGNKSMYCNLSMQEMPVDTCTVNGDKDYFCDPGEAKCDYTYLGPDEPDAEKVEVCTAGTGSICSD